MLHEDQPNNDPSSSHAAPRHLEDQAWITWVALLVQRYLSNTASFGLYGTTCLSRLTEFAALFTVVEEPLRLLLLLIRIQIIIILTIIIIIKIITILIIMTIIVITIVIITYYAWHILKTTSGFVCSPSCVLTLRRGASKLRLELLGWHYWSNATCLTRPQLFSAATLV